MIFAVAVTIVVVLLSYGTYWQAVSHANRVLGLVEASDGTYMVVGRSGGLAGGWEIVLYYKKKGSFWIVYPIGHEKDLSKLVKIKESAEQAIVLQADSVLASLDLTRLLAGNDHQKDIPPEYIVPGNNPFNKSAIVHPGDANWPSNVPSNDKR